MINKSSALARRASEPLTEIIPEPRYAFDGGGDEAFAIVDVPFGLVRSHKCWRRPAGFRRWRRSLRNGALL